MRVIFLDFDGVVVCLPVERTETPSGRKVHALNRDAVARLNELVKRTDARVVVSSTWRLHEPIEYLRGYLERAGFEGEVVGVTPDLDERLPSGIWHRLERGHEVKAWLDAHPEVTAYVALDDDGDLGPLPPERWILVKDGWFNGGLQDEHVDRAAAMLTVQLGAPACA